MRASRPGGSGSGGADHGLAVTRRAFTALLGIVAARLVWLQLIDGPRLAAAAAEQTTNVATLRARRGTIYDRNGNVIAMSEDCKTVYANPSVVTDPSGVADVLVDELGGEKSAFMELLTKETTFVYLKRQVDTDVASKISERLSELELEGVYYLDDTKRVYPYGNVGAQVLGYVGTEGKGLSGLELYYDDVLTGTDGEMIMETGADGTPIAGGASSVTEAKDGTDLVISIDIDLQQACEEIIREAPETYDAESGSVMVTDPRTGEILAACSTPLPDFSNISDTMEELSLKLVSSAYEPGSVFKVLTTSIGFDLGLFNPDSVYTVPAAVLVGDDYVTDDDNRDYTEDMDVREMMRRSSNTAMSLLVQDVIGAQRFSEGVARYGIGSATGIDFPGETAGIVKSLDEYDGATAGSMAFGQAVSIPMVQLVRAYSAVANDGVPSTPHFLVSKGGEEASWPLGDPVISAEAADMETSVMRTVMEEGTGRSGQVEGYDVAGKTGTGEQASEEGGYGAYDFTASLCGFVNADSPEALVYVGLNHLPHLASASAAKVFHDVMAQTVGIMGVKPVS